MEASSGSEAEEDSAPFLLPRTATAFDISSSPTSDRDEAVSTNFDLRDTSLSSGKIVLSSQEDGSGSSNSRVLICLYSSHFLSRWGNRMWEFAVGLFMIEVWPDSLLLAAIYGLTEALSIAIFGGIVGNLVDSTPRLRVIQISLAVQNSSIILAGVAMATLLAFPGSLLPGGSKTLIVLVILVNLFGALAALSGLANNIVVERDWVVVISQGQAPEMLAQMNGVMRRIDLSCKLLAPVLVGALMSGVSALMCAVMIAVWNALSVGFEYWFLHYVYYSISELQKVAKSEEPAVSAGTLVGMDSQGVSSNQSYHPVQVDEDVTNEDIMTTPKVSFLERCFGGWRVYWNQEMLLPGVALALLYFTVLSFGSLMTAVLNWRGVPAYVLGLARGVAALVGILATVAYPLVHSRLNTVRTGLWSIWMQWSLLSLCATSVLVHNGVEASVLLICGVAASRFGLWMFDLAVTQLMQESIPEHERGAVGGVQNSLQSIMDMLSYIVAIIISDPEKFWIPVLMSYGSVGLSALLYASYVHKVRGHLLHWERIFPKFMF